MQLEIAVLSKPGGRKRNEDACGYWTSDGACCWVLSDGAGGHGGGDVASKLVVSTILREFAAAPAANGAALTRLIHMANRVLLGEQQTRPQLADMRATVAVLIVDSQTGMARWAHAGDTRLYCYRNGRVLVRTRDHSVLQSLLEAGYSDTDMLRNHPQRNVLLCALGAAEEELVPNLTDAQMPVRDGDAFLVCSDGWWEYVDEPAMERTLAAAATAQEWLAAMEAELLERAKKDHDNYSAIGVWIGRPAVEVLATPA